MRHLNSRHRYLFSLCLGFGAMGPLGACGDDTGVDDSSSTDTLSATASISGSDSQSVSGHVDTSTSTTLIESSSTSSTSETTPTSSEDESSTDETSSQTTTEATTSEETTSEETTSEETTEATTTAEETTTEPEEDSSDTTTTTTSEIPIDCSNTPDCGDGCQQQGEQCDDGGNAGGDGCSPTCQIERCGNFLVDEDESCDDGNDDALDGCSPLCQLECGDGVIAGEETCDDGDREDDALCTATCQLKCGDGTLSDGEECDDSNHNSGDGCSSLCTLESCGNEIVDADETCDDGNREFGDGCDYWCQTECGNQHRFLYSGNEQCDDGNTVANDGCSPLCQLECGDGVVGPAEECEPDVDDDCDERCHRLCGNGELDLEEECDDGNSDNNDGCSSTCTETIAMIAAGGLSSCAIVPDGSLRCWGSNSLGQLGHSDGDYVSIGDDADETPATANAVVFSDDLQVEMVTLGDEFACARLTDERAYCWGANNEGQLGRGTVSANELLDVNDLQALDVGTVNDAIRYIDAGSDFACAVVDYTYEVKCWGHNDVRQLGDGTTTDTETPATAVALGGHPARKVVAGDSTACALLDVPSANDTVRCWGEGDDGQLGDGLGADSADATPSVIALSGNATDVAVGSSHVCAIVDGDATCWGLNDQGQLGIAKATGSSNVPATPVTIAEETLVTVAVGEAHTCVLSELGAVYCWGANDVGQLGNGDTAGTADTHLPIAIDFGSDDSGVLTASALAAGTNFSCALLSNGHVRCWGGGADGQLGQGDTSNLGDTELVSTVADVHVVGPKPICGNGVTEAWESCDDGNTSNDDTCPANCYSPCGDGIAFQNEECDDGNSDPDDGCTNTCQETFFKVFAGGLNTYALSEDGLFKGWGNGGEAQYVPISGYGEGFDPDLGTNLGDDEPPSAHIVFLDFVFQTYMQHIYYGDYFAEQAEELSFDFIGTRAITASSEHACAIGLNEKMYCWGINDDGRLGFGTDTSTPIPLAVTLGTHTVKQMGLGYTFTCALFDDQQVRCWGSNAAGQLGLGSDDESLNVYGATAPLVFDQNPDDGSVVTVDLLAVGSQHACAKASNGKVYCWGEGDQKRLGTGDDTDRYEPDLTSPVSLGSGTVRALAAGQDLTCALIESTGTTRIRCWGESDHGMLGDGGATGAPGIGNAFTVAGTPVKLVVGNSHACVLNDRGQVFCWGDNSAGQILGGVTASFDAPVEIDLGTDDDGTPSTALDLAAGAGHNCIVASDHRIRCWGYSDNGQTGLGIGNYGDEGDETSVGFERNVDVLGGTWSWFD